MTLESTRTNGTAYPSEATLQPLENGHKRSMSTPSVSSTSSLHASEDLVLYVNGITPPSESQPLQGAYPSQLHQNNMDLETAQPVETNSKSSLCYKQRVQRIASAVFTILECLEEDPQRDGLQKTPERYAKVRRHFFATRVIFQFRVKHSQRFLILYD